MGVKNNRVWRHHLEADAYVGCLGTDNMFLYCFVSVLFQQMQTCDHCLQQNFTSVGIPLPQRTH